MSRKEGEPYASKHPVGGMNRIDEQISAAIREKAAEGKISCRDAVGIAKNLNTGVDVVGLNIDLLELQISQCQLGLFGYKPEKRIVKAANCVSPELEGAIREALEGNRLSCLVAWGIADVRGLSRMAVSSACETLRIKIKPCQLGAF
jgi:hypothetical protein